MLHLVKRGLRFLFPTPEQATLRQLRKNKLAPGRPEIRLFNGFSIRGLTALEAYHEFKDLYIQRIYAFHATRPDPLIIDGGAYVGFSVLWFKHAYPSARLLAFECDPDILQVLKSNLELNRVRDVEIVERALAGDEQGRSFQSTGADSGSFMSGSTGGQRVPTCRLSTYLQQPVDLLTQLSF